MPILLALTPPALPDNLDFTLYFNILFFSILGLDILFGFIKGFKKSLYGFIVKLIFVIIFFFTIDLVVNFLWSVEIPAMGQLFGMIDSSFSSAASFAQLTDKAVQLYLGDFLGTYATSDQVLALAYSIGMFALKIVYTLLYFTVIQLIYRIFTGIIRLIFIHPSKEEKKYQSKNRGFGALFGLMSGALNVFLVLVILSGIISVSSSISTFATEALPNLPTNIDMEMPRQQIYEANHSVIPLADGENDSMDDAIAMLQEMIDAYNQNIIVSNADKIKIEEISGETPLDIYLFDKVLSIDYNGESISIRHELAVYANVAETVLNSPFFDSNNISDITGLEIETAFDELAQSNLLTSVIPLALEIAAEKFEVTLPYTLEELNDIPWDEEISDLGTAAALIFDFVNTAGLFDEGTDLETVTFNGDDARDIFEALGDSKLVTMAAFVAVQPLLEAAPENVSMIVTVPTDLDWQTEFYSFGTIVDAVLDTNITYASLTSNNPMEILNSLSSLDFTVLLQSQIISQALVNMFEHAEEIFGEDALSFLDIPSDIIWYDFYDGDTLVHGELYNILYALNALTSATSDVNFENLSISTIAELDLSSIDAIFESTILVASLTKTLREQEFGDFVLTIPNTAFEDNDYENGYLRKEELINMVDAMAEIVNNLTCDPDDTECEDTGFDLGKAFTLSSSSVEIILESDIVWATLGKQVIDNADEFLLIPDTGGSRETIDVEDETVCVISRLEMQNLFDAISVLGIESIDDIDGLDATLVTDIVSDDAKITTLLTSKIVSATVGDLLYDLGEDTLTIPQEVEMTVYEYETGYTIVNSEEIEKLLKAVGVLEIEDIENMDIGPSFLYNLEAPKENPQDTPVIDQDKADRLFDSLIIHATISKVILDLTEPEGDEEPVISVPYFSPDNTTLVPDIRYFNDTDSFEWISVDELEDIISAILVLDIEDFNGLSIESLDLDSITDNIGIILESAVLHASISDQIINLNADDIIIPDRNYDDDADIIFTRGIGEQETTYIYDGEIENTLKAIQTLGIQMDDPEVTSSLIDSLALEGSETRELDDQKLDTLFSSSIIQASMSKMILDFAVDDGETSAVLVVPLYSPELLDPADPESDLVIKTVAGTDYISSLELRNLFKAYYVLDIEDMSVVDTLGVDNIFSNLDILLTSAILHATISDQIINMESDAVVIPSINTDDVAVIFTTGSGADETTFITADEIEKTFDALDEMGIDFNNPAFDATIINNLATEIEPGVYSETLDDAKLDIVFDSAIIHASISKMLFDLTEDTPTEEAVLTVPFKDYAGVDIKFTSHEVNYITKTELKACMNAMYVLDVTTNFDDVESISLTTINENFTTMIASAILHATISHQFLTLETTDIEVPYYNYAGVSIRTTWTTGLDTDEYLDDEELRKTFLALDILGINDLSSPDVSINLTTFYDQPNRDILLASCIAHQAVSKQLVEMGEDTLEIPYFDEDGNAIRITRGVVLDGTNTEYVATSEIDAMFEVMEQLGILTLDDVDITINISDYYDPSPRGILLASASVQLEISKQILEVEDSILDVPFKNETGDDIRKILGDTLAGTDCEYVSETEIDALFEVLEVFGVTSLTLTSEDMTLTMSDLYDETTRGILLSSASVQLKISTEMFNLDNVQDKLTVPSKDVDGISVQFTRANPDDLVDDLFITQGEINNFMEALEIMAGEDETINDITDFGGSLKLSVLYEAANRTEIFKSATMHATISDQLLHIDLTGEIVVPQTDVNYTVDSVKKDVDGNMYIVEDELDLFFESVETLGISNDSLDILNFECDINLGTYFKSENPGTYGDNQNILLASAIMQATITKQLLDLNDDYLYVPDTDIDGIQIFENVNGTDFIYVFELKFIIDAVDVLDVGTSIDSINGAFNLGNLSASEDQDTLLLSASMHATISNKLFGIDDNYLRVPEKNQNGTSLVIATGLPMEPTTDFVIKGEIKALINALNIVGLNDLNDVTTEFEPSDIFTNPEIVFLSASMQAMISERIIAETGSSLVIPYLYYGTINEIVIDLTGVVTPTTYIEYTELVALMHSLDLLGLNSISTSWNFDFSQMMTVDDYDTVVASEIIQATISDNLLANVKAETDTPILVTELIVPNYYRQSISAMVNQITESKVQVEQDELGDLLTSLKMLGFTSFTSPVSVTTVTTIFSDPVQSAVFMTSGSIHVTLDHMLRQNSYITVPDMATCDYNGAPTVYNMSGVTTKEEITYFITGMTTMGISDFTDSDISFDTIKNLSPGQQSTVLDSMIIRNKITPDVETACLVASPPYILYNTDYMEDNPTTFLRKDPIILVIAYISE